MNKYFKNGLLAAVVGVGVLSSCSDNPLDADKYLEDRRTIETIFTDINQTHGWLAQAFSFLKGDLADCRTKGGAYFHCFADDMYYGDRDSNLGSDFPYMESYNAIKQGDYDENFGEGAWLNAYKGIFQASVFIQNIDMNTKFTETERLDLKGQARFVRAYYYWLLLRRYGPVPIMPEEGADYTLSYDELSYPRNSYEEVAEYIGSEMVKAATELQSWSRFQGNTDASSIIRPTRGAALATRALAYIYAASPLANGQLANGYHPAGVTDGFARKLVNKDGKVLLGLTYDEYKWARAAAACRDVIECPSNYELYHAGLITVDNKTTGYPKTITPPEDGDFSTRAWPEGWADIDPYISYRDLFNGVVGLDNSEIIFSRGYNAADSRHDNVDGFVTHELPTSLNGFNCHGLTQKMVDAYYMNDGADVPGKDSEMNGGDGSDRVQGWTENRGTYPASKYPPLGVGVSMQYANREPRFYASVAFNGSYWWDADPNRETNGKYFQVFYWRGAQNGYNNGTYYLRTGVGCKKWVNPSDYRETRDGEDYTNIVQKWEPAIRYADILLLYAEALNELNSSYTVASWDGTTTYNLSRNIDEMKRGIRPVRCRAGLPDFTLGEYSDQATLRDKIKRERMIEFLGEGKRYYDLRRWMDAPVEESKTVYGCNVMMTSNQKNEFQKIVPIYNLPTVFTEKMYFWPISFSELKRNKQLVQNPGWQLQD